MEHRVKRELSKTGEPGTGSNGNDTTKSHLRHKEKDEVFSGTREPRDECSRM